MFFVFIGKLIFLILLVYIYIIYSSNARDETTYFNIKCLLNNRFSKRNEKFHGNSTNRCTKIHKSVTVPIIFLQYTFATLQLNTEVNNFNQSVVARVFHGSSAGVRKISSTLMHSLLSNCIQCFFISKE